MIPARSLLFALAACLALAACATRPATTPVAPGSPVAPPARPEPEPAPPANARALPLVAGPALSDLPGWTAGEQAAALVAFKRSCPSLVRRADPSGLTTPDDWRAPCDSLASVADPRAFFETQFAAVIVGDGAGLNTGYFEPELAGSLTPGPGFPVPLYKRPADLIDVPLGDFVDSLKGRSVRGSVEGAKLVPYFDRAAIEAGALAGRGLELAWVADPYEAFFLQIQGSGRIRLPDGSVLRVGYDGQNGREYVGIGKRLRDQNMLAPGQATMDGIIAWLRANPEPGRALMNENKSYVFFRKLDSTLDGPLGALGVALTPQVSVAADPAFIPLGAPLWLVSRHPDPDDPQQGWPIARLMVAQDTGGAIKGPNRLDLFWGAGAQARVIAGGMSFRGSTTLLLPRAAAERLTADRPAVAGGDPILTAAR